GRHRLLRARRFALAVDANVGTAAHPQARGATFSARRDLRHGRRAVAEDVETSMPVARVKRGLSASAAVAGGILSSRIAGLIRERVFAHYLGNSDAAGAFKAALRIPNILQNLFGEGVLSASFIPVYARLRGQGRDEDASRVASAVANLLLLTVAVLVA